jgi:hypothetical protein
MTAPANSFRGFKVIGVFLLFGAVMAFFGGATLLWRGSFLDRLWVLNPRAYTQLAPYGKTAGMAFLLLGSVLAVASAGWFQRRFWGWTLAVAVIATQVVGNLVNAISGDLLKGGIGLTLAGALLYFVLRPKVRGVFASGPRARDPQ